MPDAAENDGSNRNYGLTAAAEGAEIALPKLPYLPPRPKRYRPSIGVIGCGGISAEHLRAYANAGYHVAALADRDGAKARDRAEEFAPQADAYDDADALLGRPDIDVVDITVPPADRPPLILDALSAGKHVLSQKPFVTDLDVGERLCRAAEQHGRLLAVNQNGRWAPWVSWMRQAIARELIGEVGGVDTLISWDHSWVKGTPYEEIRHLILYDFGIHWFDMVHCYTRGQRAIEVHATAAAAPDQAVAPPLLAQASMRLEHGLANLSFRGASKWRPVNATLITGSEGVLLSQGPDLEDQRVELQTAAGRCSPTLEGSWFPGGFDGAMSELLVAIEEDRQPDNSGRDNLEALAICFAAVDSAESGRPVEVGSVRNLTGLL